MGKMPDADAQDRRSAKRGAGMLSACLICGDDGQMVNCVLLDISPLGAKIMHRKRSTDGKAVDLSSGQRLMIAAFIDFPVEVIWQVGTVVGLRFLIDAQQVAAALKERLPECGVGDDAEPDAA